MPRFGYIATKQKQPHFSGYEPSMKLPTFTLKHLTDLEALKEFHEELSLKEALPVTLRHTKTSKGIHHRGRHRLSTKSRIVSPPSKEIDQRHLKGILCQPRERFPEYPSHIRPLRGDQKRTPSHTSFTKISRKIVNTSALEALNETYEERDDYIIVFRVLSKQEIQDFATITHEIRGIYTVPF